MEILFLNTAIKKGFSKETIFDKIISLENEFFPKYPYSLEDIKNAHEQSRGNSLILIEKNELIGYLMPILFKNKDYIQILTVAIDRDY
ncbi:MAG: hypothetical protein QQN44_07455, partial [Nitrosopumilus sp.]